MPKLSILLFFSIAVFPQEQPRAFSLQQAIDYALTNNRSALDSQSDVRFAELQKWLYKIFISGRNNLITHLDNSDFGA